MQKISTWMWIIPLAVGWIFDLLFWGQQQPGINFAIFALACVASGLIFVWVRGCRPTPASLVLLIPWAFFAVMTFIRIEPFTLMLSYMLTLALMALLANTLLGGRWMLYGVSDYVAGVVLLGASTFTAAIQYWAEQARTSINQPAPEQPKTARTGVWKRSAPVIRGVILALPVVAVFAALLASADPIFSKEISNFLNIFKIENLSEYLFRIFYILVIAYLLMGVFLHALNRSYDKHLIGLEKPLLSPFFGFTEAAIILGSVELLFLFFVGIQFRYFFGGNANINVEGFTFAEYARRGFGELVMVAFFSLLLFLGLSTIVRRESERQKRIFTGLGLALVVLVGIILVSAFQRLVLYEQAYGFTRLRAYTHIFIIWLGALLLAVVIMDLFSRLRYFMMAALITALCFGITINLMNVDGFIARQNVDNALHHTMALDSPYLSSLSTDAVPSMVELFKSPDLPKDVHDDLGGVLACQLVLLKVNEPARWQSFNFSRYNANQALLTVDLNAFPTSLESGMGLAVSVNSKLRPCVSSQYGD